MSYEGGGTQGPPGPTGPTGPSGGDFSGPTASILWYDGSGVTGTETFKWRNGEIYGYTIYGGPSENTIMFDDGAGSMQINISQNNLGKSIGLNANSTYITLVDETAGEPRIPGSIQIGIDGIDGTSGQFLGSDGAGNVVWSSPLPSGLSEIGITGSTDYYIALPFTPIITQNAVIQATLQVPDDDTQNWIVYAEPEFGPANSQFIHVNFAAPVENGGTTIAWAVMALDCTPTNPSTGIPV